VEDLQEDSNIAAERTLHDKVAGFRLTRTAPLDSQETDYLRDRFQDLQANDEVEAEEGYNSVSEPQRGLDHIAQSKRRLSMPGLSIPS
jgi:hypothetical protein